MAIKMKSEEKLCCRRLSRELSMDNSSFEVYYRNASAAVPFMWESQPGTPKCNFSEISFPPVLTPPPSFHVNKEKNTLKKSNLLQTVLFLPRFNLKKSRLLSSPTSSNSSPLSSSTSYSVLTSPYARRQVGFSCPRYSFDDHEDDYVVSSTPCFGVARGANTRSRGCSASMIKLLFREVA
ncbi:PREDICTED: uncharacterized protein LOC109230512 [Nicotiana attenuata]|uniref:Uncharacterized protein n=1 Tax=Nicotiana attenuata TaxID=49451 RepID=A0A1J6IJR8_NICAT|nr:PREDICTED: uncharacterized protein LOC109230512 [Nicotiana attenuata]OIT00776.1 hypothetical protein A4A49_33498 [Nicotiana attenuata]